MKNSKTENNISWSTDFPQNMKNMKRAWRNFYESERFPETVYKTSSI